jgi:hypothetical protein
MSTSLSRENEEAPPAAIRIMTTYLQPVVIVPLTPGYRINETMEHTKGERVTRYGYFDFCSQIS